MAAQLVTAETTWTLPRIPASLCPEETCVRVIFAGRNNSFNRKFVTELFRDHELISCLFLEVGRESWGARLNKIRRRMKRYGIVRVVDELAFHVVDRVFHRKRAQRFLQQAPEFFCDWPDLPCPSFDVDNIHSKRWLEYIEEQQPDILFSICCNVIFRPQLFNIPKLGTYVLHEGLTPEYKGLHTPIWALLNQEPEYVGYTMLRVNEQVDGGEVLSQGRYELAEGEDVRAWSWIGHKALIDGLPAMREALAELDHNGSFQPLSIEGRKHGYYTWVPLSTYLAKRYFAPRRAKLASS